jgi:hypothetical protein
MLIRESSTGFQNLIRWAHSRGREGRPKAMNSQAHFLAKKGLENRMDYSNLSRSLFEE